MDHSMFDNTPTSSRPPPAAPAKREARVVLPHRIQRPGYAPLTRLQGDVAQTDMMSLAKKASDEAQQALRDSGSNDGGGNSPMPSTGISAAAQQYARPRVASAAPSGPFLPTALSAAGNTSTAIPPIHPPAKPRISSAMGIYRTRIEEGAKIGGGLQAPTAKLINGRVSDHFNPATTWHNDRRYHPTNVMLSPLLQEKQLQELKEAMFAPSKKGKAAAAVAAPAAAVQQKNGGEGEGEDNTFLTGANIEEGQPQQTPAQPAVPDPAATSGGGKKKKNASLNTSTLNGKIGLRRLPNSDVALNDIYAAHSVALPPPEAPLFGGCLTSDPTKKIPPANAPKLAPPTMLNEHNLGILGVTGTATTKKKKGPIAPLISNISAIHRGLAPHVDVSMGDIALHHVSKYLVGLVPPEQSDEANATYIQPFLKVTYDDWVTLQQTAGGSAVAGTTGADAEEMLNQTAASGTTETLSTADVNDAASTVGGRSHRAQSRIGAAAMRSPSVAESRAASPSLAGGTLRHGSPSGVGLNATSRAGGAGLNSTLNQQQQKELLHQQKLAREKQEQEEFFATARLPYAHIVAAFEKLLKPQPPVSNMIPDYVSGAFLSARVCFQLCDPLKRGYITKESVKAMRNDATTSEDYNFNVVQGLTRAMNTIDRLESERFIVAAKKGKSKKSKKAPPMPTIRQFHMSLDEFTHVLSTDAFVALSFLPYIIKTMMNGVRDEIAASRVEFYGKSQVAYSALDRMNFREKKAAEACLEAPINLAEMTADEIAARLQTRTYPPIVSALAHNGGLSGGADGKGNDGPRTSNTGDGEESDAAATGQQVSLADALQSGVVSATESAANHGARVGGGSRRGSAEIAIAPANDGTIDYVV